MSGKERPNQVHSASPSSSTLPLHQRLFSAQYMLSMYILVWCVALWTLLCHDTFLVQVSESEQVPLAGLPAVLVSDLTI